MKVFCVLFIVLVCLVFVFGNETEIISKRSYTSKTYSLDNGQLKQVIYPYPIHYLSGNRYEPIPEGEDSDYYRNLASDQMNRSDDKFGPSRTNSSINNYNLGAWEAIYYSIDGNTYYMNNSNTPYSIGNGYTNEYNWWRHRIFNQWVFQGLNTEYLVDSTVYEITMSSGVIYADDVTIQWKFLGWDYLWDSDPEEEYDAIGDGDQIGSIEIDEGFGSQKTEKIKWNSGAGLSEIIQNQLDIPNSNFIFYSGLRIDCDSDNEYNVLTLSSQLITVYYNPPKKTILVDNTIYNTATSVGGELEFTAGTRPSETPAVNDAGDYVVLFLDSSYTILEPDYEITYSSVDYTHHSWKDDTDEYELDHCFSVDEYSEEQVGYFKERKTVTITKQNGDDAIQIKDPWWKNPSTGERENPATFQSLSGTSYDVFLDQNHDFIEGTPVYTLKAPKVGQVTTSSIYVFDHWSASPSEERV